MSRVVKARTSAVASSIAYNFDDLQQQCDTLLARARQEAAQLIEEAKVSIERQRKEQHAIGLAEGHDQGLANAQAEIEARANQLAVVRLGERLQTTVPALQAAVTGIQSARQQWLANWETAAIELSLAIAERILRKSIASDPQVSVHLVSEALQLAGGNTRVTLRLNPDDVAHLQRFGDAGLRALEASDTARLVADPQITPGGCIVETTHGVIDARLETQLDRIACELLGDAPAAA